MTRQEIAQQVASRLPRIPIAFPEDIVLLCFARFSLSRDVVGVSGQLHGLVRDVVGFSGFPVSYVRVNQGDHRGWRAHSTGYQAGVGDCVVAHACEG